MKIDWFKLIVSVVGCEAVGNIGTIFTAPKIPTWYAGLVKPAFQPPSWLFGPVWTALFLLMGIAFYLVWSGKGMAGARKTAMWVFGIQFVLNVLWSALFFGMQSPLLGFICIAGLWIAIVLTIKAFHDVSRPAAYLLVPYIAWVSFAAVLNYAVMMLNP
jgi:tryptophan-rich sensory protein